MSTTIKENKEGLVDIEEYLAYTVSNNNETAFLGGWEGDYQPCKDFRNVVQFETRANAKEACDEFFTDIDEDYSEFVYRITEVSIKKGEN